ncbi:MAG: protein kinase, partial [Paludibacteraceae bacterium]|nr:protein kinase [Paludibacteraceae bacterium]
YMAQLCEAVEHIHANHILHRDIKPDNIIITPSNNVVLIDFGSARGFVHDKEQKHTAMLTMGYAPIEQYTVSSKKGNYTDLYAVGGTFYFILTGQKPIPAADRMLNDELQPPHAINPSIPEVASRTIMKALNVKPEERYQTVAEFQNDLLGKTESFSATPQSSSQTPTPTQQPALSKMPAWVGILIGILIVIGLTVALSIQLSSSVQEPQPAQVDTVVVKEESQPEPAPQPSLITQGMVYDVVVAYYEDYDDYNQKLSDIRSQGYPGAFLVSFEQSVGGARVIALRTRSKSEAERTQQALKRLGEKAWLWHHDCDDLSNAPELGHKRGRIHDKDGWCNVRAGQSNNAEIIGILYEGEEILFERTNSNWYEIYDPDSEEFIGYVHKTRIRQ